MFDGFDICLLGEVVGFKVDGDGFLVVCFGLGIGY